MGAPLAFLLEEARRRRKEYGWSSASLFQRRLRVTAKLAAYLQAEVGDDSPASHWT